MFDKDMLLTVDFTALNIDEPCDIFWLCGVFNV